MNFKRIISLLSVTAILFLFPLGVRAEKLTVYNIEDADVSVSLPADMEVLTRSTPENSELFTKHNTARGNLLSGNIYLQGFSADESQVITLTVTEDNNSKNVYNYSLLTESQLESIRETYVQTDSCKGCTVEKYNKVIYFTSFVNQKDAGGNIIYLEQSDTVVNGRYVHLVLQSQDGELNNADKEFMKQVLENIKFQVKPNPTTDKNILYLIWGTVGVLGFVIIVMFFSMIFRKRRKKKALQRINDRMYNRDSKHKKEVEKRRQNRHTAMGAERPDAFFDGVDGFETSQSMDKLERRLLREAHTRYDEQVKQQENTEPKPKGKKSKKAER